MSVKDAKKFVAAGTMSLTSRMVRIDVANREKPLYFWPNSFCELIGSRRVKDITVYELKEDTSTGASEK